MRLLPHPAVHPGPVQGFEVFAARRVADALELSYRLDADLSGLYVPPAATPARQDGLWRHTCFEAFLALPGSPAYREFNFSPSGEWAAYSFTGYRSGMAQLAAPAVPEAHWQRGERELRLDVVLGADWLPDGIGQGALRLALAAVIEERSGTMSHWALRHPPGQPDFHHRDGFVLDLAGEAVQ
jgi:hypothetical protein